MSTPALPSAVAESVGKTLKLWTLHGTVTPSHAADPVELLNMGHGYTVYQQPVSCSGYVSVRRPHGRIPLNLTPLEANSDYAATTGDACVRPDWGVVWALRCSDSAPATVGRQDHAVDIGRVVGQQPGLDTCLYTVSRIQLSHP